MGYPEDDPFYKKIIDNIKRSKSFIGLSNQQMEDLLEVVKQTFKASLIEPA